MLNVERRRGIQIQAKAERRIQIQLHAIRRTVYPDEVGASRKIQIQVKAKAERRKPESGDKYSFKL